MRSPEVSGKRLELIKEILPNIRRIGVIWNPRNASHAVILRESQETAKSMKLDLHPLVVQKPADFDSAFASLVRAKTGAFTLFRDSFILVHAKRLVDFAAKNRIPAVYDGREFTLAGGLMSYTPNHLDLYRRAAMYVDKILKGSNPGDLPVEQTMRAEFLLNLKAANQIGLKIPPEVLARADRVIQ
jgi:putative ABC transport system substrate-binding protein